MTPTAALRKQSIAVAARLTLCGRVQGIGLRPAVSRLAHELELAGWIANTRDGVQIHVEGASQAVKRFELELRGRLPEAAVIESLCSTPTEPARLARFEIVASSDGADEVGPVALAARAPVDVATCAQCLAEIRSPDDRRSGYPFTSCTDCGPRYSILESMPYDRSRTSMSTFSLCPRCAVEYAGPDRRLHAQTNACSDCGPQVWLCDADGRAIAQRSDALRAAAEAICKGRILALRGLGGYQLIVDATSPDAVARLRNRKGRHGKPLAVLVGRLEMANRLARLDEVEKRLLSGPAGPIVVVQSRAESPLAAGVSAGLSSVGLMLPTTPLHALLADRCRRPLVVTSGNREGEPLAYRREVASKQLSGIADLWLEHDRPICRPVDDSVVRVMAGRGATIRLARGYAPLALEINSPSGVVALGGHQKTAVALCNGRQSILGPHVGDLDGLAARERYLEQLHALRTLYGAPPEVDLAADEHPEYFTSCWAEDGRATVVGVQHHHAHIVAGMLEHGWLDRQVLGVAFDGTGYGADGTIWGGEFLLSTASGAQRMGHLRPFRLPGGERAAREPWRVATALACDAGGMEWAARLAFSTADARTLAPLIQHPRLSPLTTSAGRMFDGVAALALGVERSLFEGHAAMLLEAACDPTDEIAYCIPLRDGSPIELDWRPMIERLLLDRRVGVSPGAMAMRFHRGLAASVAELCRRFRPLPIVLGGGVFQNRVLVELLAEHFSDGQQQLGLPGVIPTNDGGLAAGQLAVALATLQKR